MLFGTGEIFIQLPLFAAGGLAFGTVYFWALRRHSGHFLGNASPWLGGAYALGRIVAATLAFFLVSRLGPIALLGAFLGFLAARTIAVIRMRRSHD